MTEPQYDFDQIIDRNNSDSSKWNKYPPDVIPLWVADMDFRSPQPVIDALHERVAHGIFGYGASMWAGVRPHTLISLWQKRLESLYGWPLEPEDFLFVSGVVSAIHAVYATIGQPGDAILVLTPNYWHFVDAAPDAQRELQQVPLLERRQGQTNHYEIDFEALEAAITERTRLFMFGNPHNPVGRAYERWELERLAEICLHHDLLICSDEIHQDLVLDGRQHIPIATINSEIAQRCITLTSATKAFNLAGLHLGVAISENRDLLGRLSLHYRRVGFSNLNVMGVTATAAALEYGQPWLEALRHYLAANRDYALEQIQQHLPGIVPVVPEATYLMFLDCGDTGIAGDPQAFFLEQARVALSGDWAGQGYAPYVRLNFGCPRSRLEEALARMAAALGYCSKLTNGKLK